MRAARRGDLPADPVVVLLGLLTLGGLALLGAAGLLRSLAASMRRHGDGATPDHAFYARAAAEAGEARALRQAA